MYNHAIAGTAASTILTMIFERWVSNRVFRDEGVWMERFAQDSLQGQLHL